MDPNGNDAGLMQMRRYMDWWPKDSFRWQCTPRMSTFLLYSKPKHAIHNKSYKPKLEKNINWANVQSQDLNVLRWWLADYRDWVPCYMK